jgi:hypothetical protein
MAVELFTNDCIREISELVQCIKAYYKYTTLQMRILASGIDRNLSSNFFNSRPEFKAQVSHLTLIFFPSKFAFYVVKLTYFTENEIS